MELGLENMGPYIGPFVIALVGSNALTSIVTSFLNAFFNRRRSKIENKNLEVESDVAISNTAIEIANGLRKDIDSTKKELVSTKEHLEEIWKVSIDQSKINAKLDIKNASLVNEVSRLTKYSDELLAENIEAKSEVKKLLFKFDPNKLPDES